MRKRTAILPLLFLSALTAQTIVQQWPAYPTAFVGGCAICRVTDLVWIVDETNDLITAYTRTGAQLLQFAVPAVPGIATPLPIGIKVHPRTGNLWIVDEAAIVYELSPTGAFLRSWSARPSITHGSAIALDIETASVYVCNDSARILGEFDENGSPIRTVSLVAAGSTDADGLAYNQVRRTFYLGEDNGDQVIEVDRNGALLGSWQLGALPISPEDLDLDTNTGTLFIGGGLAQRAVFEVAGIVPVPTGAAIVYGQGCPDSGGLVPRIDASEVPTVGTRESIGVQGSPGISTFAWFVLGTTRFNFSLDPIGALGCTLHADPLAVASPLLLVEGRTGFSFTHPPPVPAGFYTLTCVFLPDGTANQIGLSTANGLELRFQ